MRALLIEKPRHLIDQFGLGDAQHVRHAMQGVARLLVLADGVFAGDGFDAANARGDAAFRDDLEEADIAGAADVRASAELLAEVRDHHDADVGAVFFAEQRHGAGGNGLIESHHVGGDFGVAKNLFVHETLDFGDLGGIDRGVVAEIETKTRRFDDAAGLFDMRAENLAQRGMQQVRRGVIALGGEAFADGDFGAEFVAHGNVRQGAILWTVRPGNGGIGVDDSGHFLAGVRRRTGAVIAHLAAGFGVERRLIEDEFGIAYRRAACRRSPA